MIAHLYIISESFSNLNLSQEEIEQRICAFGQDFAFIRQHKNRNITYVNPDIYEVILFDKHTITEVLYDCNNNILDRDAKNSLRSIIEKSDKTSLSLTQIKAHTPDQKRCYGVIALEKIETLKEKLQIIYNKQNWLEFRRYYLGLYQCEPDYFIDECKIYFPELFFHEQNKESIKFLFTDYKKKTIFHLAALNDKFREIEQEAQKRGKHRQRILEDFSKESNLDEVASLEGNPKKKKTLSFNFPITNVSKKTNKEKKICCEPHLKLPYKDKNDGGYSNDQRIYFHEGESHIANGKILVGHIGRHL